MKIGAKYHTDTKYHTLYDYFVLVNDFMNEASQIKVNNKSDNWNGE